MGLKALSQDLRVVSLLVPKREADGEAVFIFVTLTPSDCVVRQEWSLD